MCGEQDLDAWFKKKALDHHQALKAAVTIAHFEGDLNPVGYFALRIGLENDADLGKSGLFSLFTQNRLFPVLYLDWLAVIKTEQRKGYGLALMGRVLETFATVARATRVPGLALTALNPKAQGYYKDWGFEPYGPTGAHQKMMLPAQSALSMVPDFNTT